MSPDSRQVLAAKRAIDLSRVRRVDVEQPLTCWTLPEHFIVWRRGLPKADEGHVGEATGVEPVPRILLTGDSAGLLLLTGSVLSS